MTKSEKIIVAVALLSTLVRVLTNYQRDRAIRMRDEAVQEARVIAALYNGLLIGRGCEVPE